MSAPPNFEEKEVNGGGIGEIKTLYNGTQFDTYKDKVWVTTLKVDKSGGDYSWLTDSEPEKIEEASKQNPTVLANLDGSEADKTSGKIIVASQGTWNNQSGLDTFFLFFSNPITITEKSMFFFFCKSKTEQNMEIRLIKQGDFETNQNNDEELIKKIYEKVKLDPLPETVETEISRPYAVLSPHLPYSQNDWIKLYCPCDTNTYVGKVYIVLVCKAIWEGFNLLKLQYV